MASTTCDACGRTWPRGASWCGACGSPLVGAHDRRRQRRDASTTTDPRGASRAGAAVVAGLLVGVLAVGWVLADPAPSGPAVDEPDAVEDGEVRLPGERDDEVAAPTDEATDVPAELVATCPGADGDSGCVRWLRRAVRASATGDVLVTVEGDQVRRIDLDGGQRVWSAGVTSRASVSTTTDGVVLVDDGIGVRALDEDDGDERWSVAGELDLPLTAPDLPPSGIAVVPAGRPGPERATAIDLTTGDVLWSVAAPGGARATVPLAGGLVLAGLGTSWSVLELDDGTVRWSSDDLPGRLVGVTGDRVVVLADGAPIATSTGRQTVATALVVVDAASGATVASLPVELRDVRSVALVDGLVVLVDRRGVRAIRAGDGTDAWRRDDLRGNLLSRRPVADPFRGEDLQVASPRVALRRSDSTVVVLRTEDGATDRVLGTPAEDGFSLGGGFLTDDAVWQVASERAEVFDLAFGTSRLVVEARNPAVVSADPPVLQVAGRLVRVDLGPPRVSRRDR